MKRNIGSFILFANSLSMFLSMWLFFISTYQLDTDVIGSTNLYGIVLIIHFCVFYVGFMLLNKGDKQPIAPYEKELDLSIQGKMKLNQLHYLSFHRTFFSSIVFFYSITTLVLVILYSLHKVGIEWPLGMFLGVILIFALAWMKMNRMYKDHAIMSDLVVYHITNKNIHAKASLTETIKDWSHFKKIQETKYFFLLLESEVGAAYLSKDMFSEFEQKEFRTFLRSLPIEKILFKN